MSAGAVMLTAVEPPGDALGAALLDELRRTLPDATFFGCGGSAMAAKGFDSLFPTDVFSVMGFTDVARALPAGLKRARQLAEEAARQKAAAAILIDGWAFSRIVAMRLRELSPETMVYKYAAPQIWASRPQRIDFVKEYFDGVLTLLPFEPDYFRPAGVPATFVGNPTFQQAWRHRGDGDAFRKRHTFGDKKLLAVLPGSRKSEVSHLASVFLSTVDLLRDVVPDLQVITPMAPSVREQVISAMDRQAAYVTFVETSEKYDAFAAADAALAASGTVSTELAIHGTPMVVGYRADALTAFWARRVVTTKYASIINVMADKFLIPEFIQEDCTAENMARALTLLLTDETAAKRQRLGFENALNDLALDGTPAARLAAEQISSWISTMAIRR